MFPRTGVESALAGPDLSSASTDKGGTHMNGESTVFAWLRAGVPLSLLVDLASPAGPDSREIAQVEEHLA